jgi:hypothetical protein
VFGASLCQVTDAQLSGNLTAVILGGRDGFSSSSVVGPAKGKPYVRWDQGNTDHEVTNANDYVSSYSLPDTNAKEWYFPLRLGLDMIRLDITLVQSAGYVPTANVPTPTLIVGASRGLLATYEDLSGYGAARGIGAPVSAYILEDFSHVDSITAEKTLWFL